MSTKEVGNPVLTHADVLEMLIGTTIGTQTPIPTSAI
jgi:hypothetical protein